MDPATQGFLNIAILGLTCGATISVPFIISNNKKHRENTNFLRNQINKHTVEIQNKVDKKLDEIDERTMRAHAELLPAYRNGGIVSSDTLHKAINLLEKSLSEKIDFLHKRLDTHNQHSVMRNSLTEDKLVEILRSEINKK